MPGLSARRKLIAENPPSELRSRRRGIKKPATTQTTTAVKRKLAARSRLLKRIGFCPAPTRTFSNRNEARAVAKIASGRLKVLIDSALSVDLLVAIWRISVPYMKML